MGEKPIDMPTVFRMRIGKHRRITLPSQLLDTFGVQVGDVFVLDTVNNTFSFERQGEVSLQQGGPAQDGQLPGEQAGEAWMPAQLVAASERMVALPGKKQYQSDLTRLRQTVANYFAGLGVPAEVLMAELEKLPTDENAAREDRLSPEEA